MFSSGPRSTLGQAFEYNQGEFYKLNNQTREEPPEPMLDAPARPTSLPTQSVKCGTHSAHVSCELEALKDQPMESFGEQSDQFYTPNESLEVDANRGSAADDSLINGNTLGELSNVETSPTACKAKERGAVKLRTISAVEQRGGIMSADMGQPKETSLNGFGIHNSIHHHPGGLTCAAQRNGADNASTAISRRSSSIKQGSVANLMEKFVSRRQRSDTHIQLHKRSLAGLGHNKMATTSLEEECYTGSDSARVSIRERRGFKWRSLFSTPKVSTTQPSSNDPPAPPRKRSVPSETMHKAQLTGFLQRGQSMEEELIKERIVLRKNSQLSPLIEDAALDFLTLATIPIGEMESGVGGEQPTSVRPFSMIESGEYECIMDKRHEHWNLMQQFAIDEESERKFDDFLRMHETIKVAAEGTKEAASTIGEEFTIEGKEPIRNDPCYSGISTLRIRNSRLRASLFKSPAEASPPIERRADEEQKNQSHKLKRRQTFNGFSFLPQEALPGQVGPNKSSIEPPSESTLQQMATGREHKREAKVQIFGNLLSLRQKKRKGAKNLVAALAAKDLSLGDCDAAECSSSNIQSGSIDEIEPPYPHNAFSTPAGAVGLRHSTSCFTNISSTPALASPHQSAGIQDLSSSSNISPFCSPSSLSAVPQLVDSPWNELDLWSTEPPSWSVKYSSLPGISPAVKRRQNVLYEIFLTEKNHCRVLYFLQHVYQAGLLDSRILDRCEVYSLLDPQILHALCEFHMRILRRMRLRIAENPVVDTMADIILEEFQAGCDTVSLAYSNFCLAREESSRLHDYYIEHNPSYKRFFEYYEREPEYKGRSFKSCLLLIAQRLTKYPILMEQAVKLSEPDSTEKELSRAAYAAVKAFAHRVDAELERVELERRWETMKNSLDSQSEGQLLGQSFNYRDLIEPIEPKADKHGVDRTTNDAAEMDALRKVLQVGSAQWQSVTGERVELQIVLFDDVLVLLQEKNGRLRFFQQRDHCYVLPLCATLIRDMKRTTEAMLIVATKRNPDMFRLVFANRTEMGLWMAAIDGARQHAPRYVRTSTGSVYVEMASRPRDDANAVEKMQHLEDATVFERWLTELNNIFAAADESEDLLQRYFEERMSFMDSLCGHLAEAPRLEKAEGARGTMSHRQIERTKKVLCTHFGGLQQKQGMTLRRLAARARKLRDADFLGICEELGVDLAGISEEEGSPPSGTATDEDREFLQRQKRPKRTKTYHGIGDSKRKNSVRRRTTIPYGEEVIEEAICKQEAEKGLSKLPFEKNASKTTTSLVVENVSLRIENNKLRKRVALQALHMAALQSRGSQALGDAGKLGPSRPRQEDTPCKGKLDKPTRESDPNSEQTATSRCPDSINGHSCTAFKQVHSPLAGMERIQPASVQMGRKSLDTTVQLGIGKSLSSTELMVPRYLAKKSETKGVEMRKQKKGKR